ncbi:PP2C family protein-serine/threonine phosphatase [Granulicoccus phenolivorans]|uniref:PP2C family protein-serine/threonine phosphatase n=1 Tax=Granulicoccus phenolivorans TaxID=266854 RepID=UPI0003F97E34|nr:PP2C family serine/threonine-protein phosphatase [Granulicoccus phenolivorans]
MKIQYAAVTRTGLVRDHNEDAILADGWVSHRDTALAGERDLTDGFALFGVFDGLGGHAGGEIASHVAAGSLAQNALLDRTTAGLIDTLQETNQLVAAIGELIPAVRGLGTTGVGVLVEPARYVLFHSGDSLAFRIAEGLDLLTEPHRTEDPVAQREFLTQAFGSPGHDPVLREHEPNEPLTLLLCSDGLHDYVEHPMIAAELADLGADLAGPAHALTDLAYANGAPDNVSVLLLRLTPTAPAA